MASPSASLPELNAELGRRAREAADTIERLRTRLRGDLDPREQVRRRPDLAVGLSLLAGYIVGHAVRRLVR